MRPGLKAPSPALRYGLAIVSVIAALGGAVLLNRYNFHGLAEPLSPFGFWPPAKPAGSS